MDKIKMQSDKIALSAERIRESSEKQAKKNTEKEEMKGPEKELKAKKSNAQKRAKLTGQKRKASDSSVSVVSVDRKNRMKTTKEVDPIAEDSAEDQS